MRFPGGKARRNLNDWQKVKLLEERIKRIERRKGNQYTKSAPAPFGAEAEAPRDQAIEGLNLSKGTAARGKFVLDHASEEIKEKLDNDEITIGRAYRLTKQEELKKELSQVFCCK